MLEELSHHGELVNLPKGSFLLREGDKRWDLFFLLNGKVEITMYVIKNEHRDVTIYRPEPGEMLEKFSFIDGSPRSASVRVSEKSVVSKFAYNTLIKQFDDNPNLGYLFMNSLTETFVKRLRRSDSGQRDFFMW